MFRPLEKKVVHVELFVSTCGTNLSKIRMSIAIYCIATILLAVDGSSLFPSIVKKLFILFIILNPFMIIHKVQ